MQKLMCDFEGWFSIAIDDVLLIKHQTGEILTAKAMLEKYGNLDDCSLESFSDAFNKALDGCMGTCDLSIEE